MRDSHTAGHPVVRVALEDYRPEIAILNEEELARVRLPASLQTIGRTVPRGSPLSISGAGYAAYFIAVTALNFRFWELGESRILRKYRFGQWTGAIAMQFAFHEAWAQIMGGAPATSPKQIAMVSEAWTDPGYEITETFGRIPAAQERQRCLMELAERRHLWEEAAIEVEEALRGGRRLVARDAERMAKEFPECFGDRYLKKAQLVLMMAAGHFRDVVAEGEEPEIPDVTAPADYQVPKVLRRLGLIEYSTALARAIDEYQLLERDGQEERAIRAATTLACRRLAERARATDAEIDFWLWSQRAAATDERHHLCLTTAY